mmetsp:Transcript_22598/g.32397  ORF Transcript_22598/g.32397 Transcript_22598/m.32397 type:complete len:135 (-) Transcript_22598:126-530(-)
MYSLKKTTTLPEWFVKKISFSFGKKFDSAESFSVFLSKETKNWSPETIVLPDMNRIGLFWNGRYNVLRSSNPEGFTALELLFQTNNLVADVMGGPLPPSEEKDQESHSYYGGFSFMSVDGNGLARYSLEVSPSA